MGDAGRPAISHARSIVPEMSESSNKPPDPQGLAVRDTSRPRPAEEVITPEDKPLMMDRLHDGRRGLLAKYADFFAGDTGLMGLARYEAVMMLAQQRSGGLGFLLRKKLFGTLLGGHGANINWGVGVSLRHPGKMSIGSKTVIDDNVLLCARGADEGPEAFVLGEDVLIGRFCIVQAKRGTLEIGSRCVLGTHSQIVSTAGFKLGSYVMTGPQCYFGGSRHGTERNGTPMIDQPTTTRGPVVIGDDVWFGTGVRVLDGVSIGTGAVIGSGSVVTKDVPDYAIARGIPAQVVAERT